MKQVSNNKNYYYGGVSAHRLMPILLFQKANKQKVTIEDVYNVKKC